MKGMAKYLVFTLFALVLTSQCAFSEDNPMGQCQMMHENDKMMSKMGLDDMLMFKMHFIMMNADEIGITDEQVKKIEAMKVDAKKGIVKNESDIEMLAIDIKSELSKEDINLNTVNTLLDRNYLIKAQIAKDSAVAYVNLKKTLTSEQQKKMKDLWLMDMRGKKGHMKMKGGEEKY